ncbi:hypothetical protein MRX96_008429 [Rhipicephalus microplus]
MRRVEVMLVMGMLIVVWAYVTSILDMVKDEVEVFILTTISKTMARRPKLWRVVAVANGALRLVTTVRHVIPAMMDHLAEETKEDDDLRQVVEASEGGRKVTGPLASLRRRANVS